jgi:uncharacterized protein (DUF1501 family)
MHPIARRRFLKAFASGGAAYALGHTPGVSFAQMAGGGEFTDYKALVCVFLFGGNDSWNMVVPRSAAEYAAYAASRQNLAVDQNALLPINPVGMGPAPFGFHPAMPELAGLFEQGRVSVIANTGPLLAPTSLDAYRNQAAPLPPQLFSHNDQQDQWHSLRGRVPSRSGWAGRIADKLAAQTTAQTMAMNLSLFGQTLFQAGNTAVPYTMGAAGPITFTGFGTTGIAQARQAAFTSLLNPTPAYATLYERAFGRTQDRAVRAAEIVSAALAAAQPLTTVFPTTGLATQLNTVARLISVRDRLQMKRQVFFVAVGGFDTHDDQLQDQPALYTTISQALGAFYQATVELGVSDRVTSFTQSDFGRTLTSNGDGTDHAWGGVHLMMGDAVRGRTIAGAYPVLRLNAQLATDGADDVGGGRFIPTTSADQYAATMAKWFGVATADIPTIAPSINAFATQDLGLFF